jgi:hypothetical protein
MDAVANELCRKSVDRMYTDNALPGLGTTCDICVPVSVTCLSLPVRVQGAAAITPVVRFKQLGDAPAYV